MSETSLAKELPFERVFDFSNKTVLVTGAANGIGLAIAELFAERGASLALVDKSAQVTEVAKTLGARARGYEVDITNEADVARAIASIVTDFGRIDVLINNAGIGGTAPAELGSVTDWRRIIDVNLSGQYVVAREVGRRMLEGGGGRVVMMASQAAIIGLDGHAAYSASKAGVLGMMRCMALEWGARRVTVNAISPTIVATEMAATHWAGEKGERARAEIPVGRFATPREVAYAALYLASDAAAMINGANLVIDGGFTIR
jgi:NAD(P)-dependent dehydrogenase (short-subunit alcohol dehydrogenase family)